MLKPPDPGAGPRAYLFLQGPISPFFSEIGARLRDRGSAVHRINLCLGDRLFWRGPGAVDFRGSLDAWPAFIDAFVERHGISDLVLLGEQRAYHRIAIEAARRHGASVTVTDFGYLRPDWITFEQDGMSALSRFPRDPGTIRALAASCPEPDMTPRYRDNFGRQARWDVTYHVANLLPFASRNYRSHQLHHPLKVYAGTGARLLSRARDNRAAERVIARLEGNPDVYLFPLQMETDFQLRAYSRFPSLSAAIDEVVGSFARTAPRAGQLMVKVHPLDPGLRDWSRVLRGIAERHGVGPRIHYLPGGNLDRAIRASRGVVTINSTVGLRAIQLDRPLHLLGEAVYRVPGLASDGPLDPFWTMGEPPDGELRSAFLRAMAATIQMRGVFYSRPGLDAAVAEAVRRLEGGFINQPLPVAELV